MPIMKRISVVSAALTSPGHLGLGLNDWRRKHVVPQRLGHDLRKDWFNVKALKVSLLG